MRVSGYLVAIFVLASVAVQAQTPPGDARAEYDAAFQASQSNPADTAAVLRYAAAAIKVNDLEGAISALERLLLVSGDQPRVKVELGTLYYRLGSYEAARAYFDSARSSGLATAEIKQRADEYLVAIDSRTGKSLFSGNLMAGLRYSTNANSGPTGSVQSSGVPVVPNPTFSQRPDFSAFTAMNVRHHYDLGRQDSGALESNFALYATRQFQVTVANVAVVDISTGPRVKPFEGWAESVSLKPFLTGRYVAVDDMTSYWAYGTGIEATAPLGSRIDGTLAIIGRQRQFVNNSDVPTNNQNTGVEAGSILDLRAELTSTLWLSFNANAMRYSAVTPWESYGEIGAGAALTKRFIDPLGINGRPWEITANIYTQIASYDQPNPVVDPAVARSQTDLGLGMVLNVPLDERFSLAAQVSYAQRWASLSNYAYNALTTLVGVGWRF
ncbi:MAG: hypothetical protein K9G48_13970 [Reyranella sp.]|nr:hypothetical protein [Reyranella sp.]